jgi:hypothetical protein
MSFSGRLSVELQFPISGMTAAPLDGDAALSRLIVAEN